MANMEKIIRPHLPANIAPEDTSAKNRSDPQNIVAKFPQSSSGIAASSGGGVASAPYEEDSYTHKTSQYSYYKKCYMRKREKEIAMEEEPPPKPPPDPKPDYGVVGSTKDAGRGPGSGGGNILS